MSLLGIKWIMWSGWLCLFPLGVWLATSGKLHPGPQKGFWVAIVCWSLLAVQIWASLHNRSHTMLAPWTTTYLVFEPIEHSYYLPSTAFWGATEQGGLFYLALGLLALTAHCLGFERKAFRRLLGLFVLNAAVLAAIGIPFKYSGEKLILGKWEFQEWYFYSTFYYHNHWAAFVLLALGAAMSLFVGTRSGTVRTLLVLTMSLLLVSLGVAKTRLGCLMGLGLVIAFCFKLRKDKSIRLPTIRWMIGGFLSLFVMGGAVFWWQSREGSDSSGGRQWESLIQSNPIGVRGTLFADTLPMVGRKPLFGWGLNAYGAAFQGFQRSESISLHNGTPTRYEHPHNDWLERIAELGLIGSTLFWLPGWLWFREAKALKAYSPGRFPLILGCCALMLFALCDMAFANNAVCSGFAVLWAAATSYRGSDSAKYGSANERSLSATESKSGLNPKRPKSRHMSRS